MAQVLQVYRTIQGLHDRGFACVSQILEELDPMSENIIAAAFQGAAEIAIGTVPLLHLPLSATFVEPVQDDFMLSARDGDAENQSMLVPWNAREQTRLAVWAAFFRSQSKQDDKQLLPHVVSLLSLADVSGYLSHEDAKHFFFAEAISAIHPTKHAQVASGALLPISKLVVRHLDPSRSEHVQMVSSLFRQVGQVEASNGDFFRSMTNLAPFLPDNDAFELIDVCTRMLETHEAEATVSLLASETFAVLVASLDPTSVVWPKVISRLPSIVEAALQPRQDGGRQSKHCDEVASRQRLLFCVIQSILQHSHRHATSSYMQILALADFSKLAQTSITSPAMDGALVAAIHAHPALALSISAAVRSILATDGPNREGALRTIPRTLLTLMSALLEQGAPALDGQEWTQAHVEPVAQLAAAAIIDGEETAGTSHELAACLIVSLRCAHKFGWEQVQAEIGNKFLAFVVSSAKSSPFKAFQRPLIEVLLGLIEEIPDFSRLSGILQSTVDAALLWLVRRFAEDSNDSSDLVQTITLFTSLVECLDDDTSPSTQLKKSLVDPVVQAAIKNRLCAVDQMRLVLELCKHTDLEPSHVSRYLGALTAHSDFTSIMRGSAAIQQPIPPGQGSSDAEEDDPPESSKQEASEQLKQLTVELVYTVASRDARTLLRAPLLTKLMSFYGATLSKSDRMLLALFRRFEEECGQSFMCLVQGWKLPASSREFVNSATEGGQSTLEALRSLDANIVLATCTEYPRSLSLHNTISYGYEGDAVDARSPRQVYGSHTNPAQRYDPVFVLSLLAGVTAPGIKLSGLEWLTVFGTNAPGLLVCGLSSRCNDMRRACLTLVSNLYLAIQEAEFQEKDHLIMVFDLVRDALDSTLAIRDSSCSEEMAAASDTAYLPITTTLFIAHALRSVVTPRSFIYPVISHFLLQRPELDVGDVPLLYNLLYTASDKYKQERMWMLRFLRDVARSGGRSDWKIFKRRRTWELLASLYDGCDGAMSGASMSSDRVLEETSMRALIEDTTTWLVRNADVAIELVTRRGLLTWMWQQAVREGVVALAEYHSGGRDNKSTDTTSVEATATSTSTLRSIWILLLARLIRSIDLDRLHRATDASWLAPTITLTSTTIKALHTCATSPSAAHTNRNLPGVSTDLIRTISYAATTVVENVLLFADEPAMGMWKNKIVEILHMLMDLVDNAFALALASETDDRVWQDCCVRVQRCALALAAASADAEQSAAATQDYQKSLALLVRRSTILCRRIDVDTSQLVLANLFSTSASA